jgi:ribose transport system substrate-binding protein
MPNVAAHDAMVDRIEAKFAGTGLKVVTIEEVAIPDWSSRLPTLTRTLLTQYPDLQYIVPLVDGMALNIVPALEQANKADQVKISTFNATPAVMKLMRDGSPVKADVGGANTWEGWAYVDQSLRLLTGAEPVEQNVPLRMFDTTNVDTIDVDGNEDDWYDTQKAIDGYKQLWGVG